MADDLRPSNGGQRVRIVGDHPHKGQSGTVRDDLPMKLEMWLVELDDRWTEGCYAGQENLRLLRPEEDPRV